MHDCLLTDDQRMIRDSARAFARDVLAPTAARRDADKAFPRAEMAALGEPGFLGMLVSEEWGGVAADHVGYVLAVEEISAADGSIGAMMALHNGLVSTPLRTHGTPAQKERYLRPLARGEMNGAFGLTEPEAGSNAFAIRTRAVKCPGGYRISGAKQFMSNGKSADVAIVFAATESDDPRRRITAFLVSTAAEGYRATRVEDKLGLSASETCQVQLDEVFVPEEDVLGQPGGGYALAMSTLELGRLGITGLLDLRSAVEVETHPDVEVPGAQWHHHEVPGIPLDDLAGLSDDDAAEEVMLRVYRGFVADPGARAAFAGLFRHLAEAEGAQLFHCTAGKDRTGWVAALLLHLAGVDDETILADYLLTNDRSAGTREKYLAMVAEGLGPEKVPVYERVLVADEAFLAAGYVAVETAYGDRATYLREGLGLDDAVLDALRARLTG